MRGWSGVALAFVIVSVFMVEPAYAATGGEPGALATGVVQDHSRRVVYTGRWTYSWDPAHSAYSARYTDRAGAKATVRIDGTGIGLVAPRGPDGGVAEIRLDGKLVGSLSLFASQPTSPTLVWWSGELKRGRHTLTVVATGASEAGAAGSRVWIDQFNYIGETLPPAKKQPIIEESDLRIQRKGTWRKRTSSTATKGLARTTREAGATMKVTFKGTGISWIGRKSPDHGLAEVILDGRRVAVVGGAPGDPREKVVLWSATGLSNKKHTLVVRALGEPGAPGTGTAVDVDGFIVTGEMLFTPRPTPFKYPWKTYIVIDKSDYRLYWVKDKMLVKTYPIAHGRKWSYTPPRVWRIDAKYRSSGVYGPRKMRLFKRVSTSRGNRYAFTRYAIHGTNQPWVIGTGASAGCIRMYNRDVLDLFPRVPLGTMVVTRD